MARPRRNQTASGSNDSNGDTQNLNGNNGTNGTRNSRPTRNITGPQSALTDFLASHNISARQIRDDADRRRQAAAQQNSSLNNNSLDLNNVPSSASLPPARVSLRQTARDGAEQESAEKTAQKEKALAEIKASKAFQKRKKEADGDSDFDEDEIARAIFSERHAPLPGQMENCELCAKRFTVTPYSVQGPNGGLLCAPCGRQVAKERQGDKPKKKAPRRQTGGIGSRRAAQSRLLDGSLGTRSLATLCVQTLAKNVELAESLGDLPEHLVDKIARIFSKRRLLNPDTLPLFLQPSTQRIHIYDGAKLGEQELIRIFQVAPGLKHFKARCVVQFKDEVMDYVLSRNTKLETFYLHGANLLSEDKLHEFLRAQGSYLHNLQIYYTDKHVGDETIEVIRQHCPNLKRLKIEHNQKMTGEGVKALANITSLEHLGLDLQNTPGSSALREAISGSGPNLKTLSLNNVPEADDSVLGYIHDTCRSLSKLRITQSHSMTDEGFASLFTRWENPPLAFIDLDKCRHVDAMDPRRNDDHVGLCSMGFKALMAHSGSRLRYLNVHSCRHISREAFEEAFNGEMVYPELRRLKISFCEEVTDYVLGCIFRSCPNIKEVNVFGCMKVRDVRVPRGIILVGVPNAQGMIIEGKD